MFCLNKCISSSSAPRQTNLNKEVNFEESLPPATDDSAKPQSSKKFRNIFIEENTKSDQVDTDLKGLKETRPKISYLMEQGRNETMKKNFNKLNFSSLSTQNQSSKSITPKIEEGQRLFEFQQEPTVTERSKTFFGFDINIYTSKKNLAQGLIDIALLNANCTQLKYILDLGPIKSVKLNASPGYFYLCSLAMVCLSIFLQILLGIFLIINSRTNVNLVKKGNGVERWNTLILISVFFITCLNILLVIFMEGIENLNIDIRDIVFNP